MIVASAVTGSKSVDSVLDHLLQNARSDAVREEFLQQAESDYTVKHTLKLLVV